MRKLKLASMLLVTVAFLAISCGAERTREDKVAAIITEMDSPILMLNMNPENLIEKSGANDGALPFTQKMLLSFFIDEEVTGVDYSTNVQIVLCEGSGFLPNGYLIFKLNNQVAFQELLEAEANAKVKEKKGFNYVIKESDSYALIWNEEFVIVGNIEMNLMDMLTGGSNNGAKTVDGLIALVEAADEGEINTDYKEFIANEADVAVSYFGEGLYSYLKEASMGQSEGLEEYKETVESASAELFLNFEAGQMTMQLLPLLSDELMEDLNIFEKGSVDEKLLNYGFSANPVFTMTALMDLDRMVAYTEKEEANLNGGDLEAALGEIGLTLRDAQQALTGEVAVIVDRIEVVEKLVDYGYGEPYTSKSSEPVVGLAIGVADPTIFNEMMVASEQVGDGIAKSGDSYLVLKEDVLFATSDSLWAFQMVAGATVAVEDKVGVLLSNSFGMYLDMMTLSKMDDVDEVRIIVDVLKNIQGSGDLDEMNISLIFKDAAKNALRSLTEAFGAFGDQGEMDDEFEQLQEELEEALNEVEEAPVDAEYDEVN